MPEPAVNPAQPLVEGRDYYMDGPWLVFTREYHLRRGSCCKSQCRHCPWNYKKSTQPTPEPVESRP
ncbi:MAG: DUF5522 domain-containing protein [Acidobacteriaceae bacterium]